MKEYIGGEFILTSDIKGLTIKRNKSGYGCGECFGWDEIEHLLDAPQKTAHNSDYAKCYKCQGGTVLKTDNYCSECGRKFKHFAERYVKKKGELMTPHEIDLRREYEYETGIEFITVTDANTKKYVRWLENRLIYSSHNNKYTAPSSTTPKSE